MQTFTLVFLIALGAELSIQLWLNRRQMRAVSSHRDQVPAAFRDTIPLSAHQKAADYTTASLRLGNIEQWTSALLLLAWTLGGGLELLDRSLRSLELGPLGTGVGFLLGFMIISGLLELPLTAWRTFGIEQRFGFNRTTIKTFITDLLKQSLLLLLLGGPLALLILWLMAHMGAYWWLAVWVAWFGFSILMMWAWPSFIAPLFNKFQPLQDTTLKQRIEDLLERNGFTSQGIFVMDGSTRSTHGNAYFTGFGANKRIVFFDTLIGELEGDEIEAVLAHELGHFKRRHVIKQLLLMGALSLAGLALLGWLIRQDWFFAGLGVDTPSSHMALVLFLLVSPVFAVLLKPLMTWLSRRYEFEADDYAAAQANPATLIRALVKLYRENANTLTPDPLYSAFHDSHPPAPVRVAYLRGKQPAPTGTG